MGTDCNSQPVFVCKACEAVKRKEDKANGS